jgi:hypothetical protein
MTRRDIYFEPEDGLVDPVNGDVLCPMCGCCSLKQVLSSAPSILTQAAMWERGEEWTPKEENMGWVCTRGCTKTQRHA